MTKENPWPEYGTEIERPVLAPPPARATAHIGILDQFDRARFGGGKRPDRPLSLLNEFARSIVQRERDTLKDLPRDTKSERDTLDIRSGELTKALNGVMSGDSYVSTKVVFRSLFGILPLTA